MAEMRDGLEGLKSQLHLSTLHGPPINDVVESRPGVEQAALKTSATTVVQETGRNIEIKARVENPKALLSVLKEISDSHETLTQTDIYFQVSRGRLKLRIVPGLGAELIYYERADALCPRESRYERIPVNCPETTLRDLSASFGVQGTIEKRRRIYLVGQTRIHLDEVERLGWFIELEVVMTDNQRNQEGTSIAQDLIKRLDIYDHEYVRCSYIDLLVATNEEKGR